MNRAWHRPSFDIPLHGAVQVPIFRCAAASRFRSGFVFLEPILLQVPIFDGWEGSFLSQNQSAQPHFWPQKVVEMSIFKYFTNLLWLRSGKSQPPGNLAMLDWLSGQPESSMPSSVQESAVAMKYIRLLGPIHWSGFPCSPGIRICPETAPTPLTALAASHISNSPRRWSRISNYVGTQVGGRPHGDTIGLSAPSFFFDFQGSTV